MLRFLVTWCLALIALQGAGAAQEGPAAEAPRVSLLGDSITAGALIEDERHRLAAQLAQRLELRWEGVTVQAFGAGGSTLLLEADHPYAKTPSWSAALESSPDVAVVMLGTNDTCLGEKRRCWEHEADLERNAQELVAALIDANPEVRVLLCPPPPMFPQDVGQNEGRKKTLTERGGRIPRIAEAFRAAARSSGPQVRFVDLARSLRAGDTLDGVHPSPFGVARIADRMAIEIDLELRGGALAELGLAERLASEGLAVEHSRWHGYRRLDFLAPLDGAQADPVACTLVAPDAVRPGAPWIWRARFFGHEPALDLRLLDLGFHLAYCDVASLFGGEQALARWASFQELCGRLGLGPRPVLEGMSRGGLPAVRYAARFPDRVAAVYGDNPVVDPRSWPGGRNGKRSDPDWQAYRDAYGLSEEAAWSREPLAGVDLDRLAGVPVLLVVGEEDGVVPVRENADVLASALGEAGQRVTSWRKPGLGHHPHGLEPVAPLFRALAREGLRAGPLPIPHELEPAVHALPSAEYRGGPAGWGGGVWWDALAHLEQVQREEADARVIFLGDSITQGLTGHSNRTALRHGKRAFDTHFGYVGALSLGLSGDRTEHLLFRIRRASFRRLQARVVVLQIGVNDIRSGGRTAEELAAGITAVVEALHEELPRAQVLLCGPFPTGPTPQAPYRRTVDEAHARLSKAFEDGPADPRTHYLDLRALFLDENGGPNERLSGDHVHITGAGQVAWMEAVRPVVEDLLER